MRAKGGETKRASQATLVATPAAVAGDIKRKKKKEKRRTLLFFFFRSALKRGDEEERVEEEAGSVSGRRVFFHGCYHTNRGPNDRHPSFFSCHTDDGIYSA